MSTSWGKDVISVVTTGSLQENIDFCQKCWKNNHHPSFRAKITKANRPQWFPFWNKLKPVILSLNLSNSSRKKTTVEPLLNSHLRDRVATLWGGRGVTGLFFGFVSCFFFPRSTTWLLGQVHAYCSLLITCPTFKVCGKSELHKSFPCKTRNVRKLLKTVSTWKRKQGSK